MKDYAVVFTYSFDTAVRMSVFAAHRSLEITEFHENARFFVRNPVFVAIISAHDIVVEGID